MPCVYADVCFGCYLTYDKGEVDHEVVEQLEEQGAQVSYDEDRGYTVWYGKKLTTISESSASIDDPRMFLQTKEGIEEMVEELRGIMGEVPVELRKKLTPPKFFLAWGR